MFRKQIKSFPSETSKRKKGNKNKKGSFFLLCATLKNYVSVAALSKGLSPFAPT